MNSYLFLILIVVSIFVSPAIALFTGIAFALLFINPYAKQAKKISKYTLQIAVVGLGFNMNLHAAMAAGKSGMMFTVLSVTGVMILGYFIGRQLKITPKLIHLISSGTAICGGSAIAAVSPLVDANEDETSVSLAVIFTLNALALFLFPPIGHLLGLSQEQFGLWSAIAIHDTSSVVGAGATYGPQALMIATTVKLTRALWIIPLSFVSMFIFRSENKKFSIPWFIFLFILAMIINTYVSIPNFLLNGIHLGSHKLLSITLFLIGSTLSHSAVKSIGIKPIMLGVILWILISVVTLFSL